MRVLDLQCARGHAFEGWFASEDDFVAQNGRALVHCPLCGDAEVHKKLSAPRLNLRSSRSAPAEEAPTETAVALPSTARQASPEKWAAWLEMSRELVANTTDVGDRFADEARKIHYGDAPERAIRGQASAQETRELLEEGIAVLPLLLPEAAKNTLQ
ncbi:MAG: DUF1178 family protein [Rhodoferax sp.]|jgi:hypothetical protein|nr:DUF1178 family protein [Rhodoferax sp.]